MARPTILVQSGINRQYFRYRPGGIIDVDTADNNIGGWASYTGYSNAVMRTSIDDTISKPVAPCVGCGSRKISYSQGVRICAYCKGAI